MSRRSRQVAREETLEQASMGRGSSDTVGICGVLPAGGGGEGGGNTSAPRQHTAVAGVW